jgi:hypothetical protein
MSIDLEYAIKQDVGNNPVVREVDREQKRGFIRTLGWAALAVGILMFKLLPTTGSVSSGYELQSLKERLAEEQTVQRQYLLELEMLLRPQEVRARAMRELHMVEPNERNTITIERQPESPAASRAIVAAAR